MRNGIVAALATALWLLGFFGQFQPDALGPDAPAGEFSEARAHQALARLLGPQRPHPAGSPEDAALRERLLAELRQEDVKASTLRAISCYGEARWGEITCATVTDIIGEVAPGFGPAIVLMAHMDSVAAGPGAADDGSGVAAILETIRAFKARKAPTRHPILALFTDGEENAMLGASAFLADPALRAKAGVMVNLEARGTQGRSFLFQTSPGDGALVNLYAHAVPYPATSSLYEEIYKLLPNDTDLTPFLQAGFTGFNFSFVGDVAQYHTPRDRLGNLDPRSLQSEGESALGVLLGLAKTDFARLKQSDAIYFDVLGRWLPRLPKSWALPLSLLVFAAIVFAGWWKRPARARWRGLLMAPALLLGALAMGFLLHEIAALISGHPDPSFAHPWALRLSLAFGVWSVALLASRLEAGVSAAWLWIAGLGVAAAMFLPGFSPYFLFPALLAAILFLLTLPLGKGMNSLAVFLAALGCAFTWLNLAATGEAIMGLAAHPIFTLGAGFALIGLMPLMRAARATTVLVSFALALVFAVVAGFLPPFSYAAPERLNLHYVEEGGRAFWTADPVARLPKGLREAGHFGGLERGPLRARAYVGDAGRAVFPPPGTDIAREGSTVTISLHGSQKASGMMLTSSAPFTLLTVDGRHFAGLPSVKRLICDTPDCAQGVVTIRQETPGGFEVVETRRGLPAKGDGLLRARPADAVPSGAGDRTLLIRSIL